MNLTLNNNHMLRLCYYLACAGLRQYRFLSRAAGDLVEARLGPAIDSLTRSQACVAETKVVC